VSGWMNPKPFVALNHFTVPVANVVTPYFDPERQPKSVWQCTARKTR